MMELLENLNMLFAPVHAAVSTQVTNPIPAINSLASLFGWVINLVLSIGLSMVILMLALGFMQYIMSRGDKVAIEKAQQWVTYAAIGGVGLFLVFAARTVIQQLVGNGLNTGTDVTVQTAE
jgi:predicted PurR-regulated permease PerM